jgi:hypothetical protein
MAVKIIEIKRLNCGAAVVTDQKLYKFVNACFPYSVRVKEAD